jgi:hypothetical protein
MKFITLNTKIRDSEEMVKAYLRIDNDSIESLLRPSIEHKTKWPAINCVINFTHGNGVFTDSTPEEVLAKIAEAEKAS